MRTHHTILKILEEHRVYNYIASNDGKIYQSYRKADHGWMQTTISNGTVRACTAEQLLSHILPPLAFRHVTVQVEPDEGVILNIKSKE